MSENKLCNTIKRVQRLNSCQHHILILTLCHYTNVPLQTHDQTKKYSSSKLFTIPTIHLLRPTCLLIRTEVDAHAIHTMSRVRRRIELFPLKNMSQVAPTIRTHYLRPCHKLWLFPYSSGDSVEEGRPTATRVELV